MGRAEHRRCVHAGHASSPARWSGPQPSPWAEAQWPVRTGGNKERNAMRGERCGCSLSSCCTTSPGANTHPSPSPPPPTPVFLMHSGSEEADPSPLNPHQSSHAAHTHATCDLQAAAPEPPAPDPPPTGSRPMHGPGAGAASSAQQAPRSSHHRCSRPREPPPFQHRSTHSP